MFLTLYLTTADSTYLRRRKKSSAYMISKLEYERFEEEKERKERQYGSRSKWILNYSLVTIQRCKKIRVLLNGTRTSKCIINEWTQMKKIAAL